MTQKVQATSEIGVNDLYIYTQMHRSYNSLVSHKLTMISCCKLTSNKMYVWVILQVTTTGNYHTTKSYWNTCFPKQ